MYGAITTPRTRDHPEPAAAARPPSSSGRLSTTHAHGEHQPAAGRWKRSGSATTARPADTEPIAERRVHEPGQAELLPAPRPAPRCRSGRSRRATPTSSCAGARRTTKVPVSSATGSRSGRGAGRPGWRSGGARTRYRSTPAAARPRRGRRRGSRSRRPPRGAPGRARTRPRRRHPRRRTPPPRADRAGPRRPG